MAELNDHVKRYCELGLRLVQLCCPVSDRCSHPYAGHGDGSIGKAPMRAGWQEHQPDGWRPGVHNIGIQTGPDSGVTVLDVDHGRGGDESLRALITRGLPPTWVAVTGSGGLHVYLRHEPAMPKATSGARPGPLHGIDVKDAGGYVVAPPSLHRVGLTYRWLVAPWEAELGEQPGWLLAMRAELKAPRSAPSAANDNGTPAGRHDRLQRARLFVDRLIRDGDVAISGQHGHATTFRVVGKVAVGFGLSEREALDALTPWNERCLPPWHEEDLLRKVQEARAHWREPEGFLLAS